MAFLSWRRRAPAWAAFERPATDSSRRQRLRAGRLLRPEDRALESLGAGCSVQVILGLLRERLFQARTAATALSRRGCPPGGCRRGVVCVKAHHFSARAAPRSDPGHRGDALARRHLADRTRCIFPYDALCVARECRQQSRDGVRRLAGSAFARGFLRRDRWRWLHKLPPLSPRLP